MKPTNGLKAFFSAFPDFMPALNVALVRHGLRPLTLSANP